MSVFKRETSKGETANYHYRFKVGGKIYRGVFKGCTTQKEALHLEKQEKELAKSLHRQKTQKAVVENHIAELAGGACIKLEDAWDLFIKKPRKKTMGERHAAIVKGRWNNFLVFLNDNYPDITHLGGVNIPIAQNYIGHIRSSGAWVPVVANQYAKRLNVSVDAILKWLDKPGCPKDKEKCMTWLVAQYNKLLKKRGRSEMPVYKEKHNKLSTAAANNYLTTCRMVYKELLKDAGMMTNPFDQEAIPKLENFAEERDAFSAEELKLIGENATGWLYTLFMVGVNTGLREGDIATLLWKEVDLSTGWISRKMRKTKKSVEVPVMPALDAYLRTLPQVDGYCFPELAERYNYRRSTIGQHVSAFLRSLGIETQRKVEGRTRAVSVKDIHSLRHTFCYLAALNGVPLPIVQSIVGHMSDSMTKHYSNHATADAKRLELAKIPDYLSPKQDEMLAQANDIRSQIQQLISSLPENKLNTALRYLKNL